jgi:hypothetical protein
MIWKYPEDVTQGNNNIKVETDLKTDKFLGAAFTQK